MSTPLPEPAALKKLRVADLKGLLESRGMDSTGKKDDLVDRLAARGQAMELEEAATPAAAPAADPAPEPVAEEPAAVEEPAAGDKPAAAAPVKVKPAGKAGHVSQLSMCAS